PDGAVRPDTELRERHDTYLGLGKQPPFGLSLKELPIRDTERPGRQGRAARPSTSPFSKSVMMHSTVTASLIYARRCCTTSSQMRVCAASPMPRSETVSEKQRAVGFSATSVTNSGGAPRSPATRATNPV